METVQKLFNSHTTGTLKLPPDEYRGPLIVNRSCVIDGSQSTLWTEKGPALIITAPHVTIKNLHIDITGKSKLGDDFVAVKATCRGTVLDNVEVNGRVLGVSGESENWNLPKSLSLGEFAAGRRNTFSLTLNAPASALIACKVNGLALSGKTLNPGRNGFLLTTDELDDNTIIYGEIVVKTTVLRRIYIWGKALNGAPAHSDIMPPSVSVRNSPNVQKMPPDDMIQPNIRDESVRPLQRGQRIFAEELHSPRIKIAYEHQSAPYGTTVEGYGFLLREGGKAANDHDLIFYNYTQSDDNSVRLAENKPIFFVDLDRVSPRIDKIVICYSIEGTDPNMNFSAIVNPVIRLFGDDEEIFRMELNELSNCKTFIGMELYRYKGKWKIKAAGNATYTGSSGLEGVEQLCNTYGIVTTKGAPN